MSSNNVTILILIDGFLQSIDIIVLGIGTICHNPYFNRWFSAIYLRLLFLNRKKMSQSLF